ncbi:MAG: HAD family hydrolase [Candidatus Bathyarchaeia archaeon]
MPETRKIKAVLFDLGGTLVKTAHVHEIHRRILKAHGIIVPLDRIAEAHGINQKELDIEEMARLGEKYWIKWNLRILERLGIKENREFLARKIDELWWEYAELTAYPDVQETLAELSNKGIKMGIVTNGTEKDFKQVLQRLNLAGYFDIVVGVDACKKAKPHKEIFLHALAKLRVKPDETIFVGDSVEHDYEGARKAGLKPVLIDRDGKGNANLDSIRHLTELLKYV